MKKNMLIANRNFWLLAVGQGLSRVGDGLYWATLAWTAWTLTRSLQTVAIITLATNLPAFVGLIIGGSFADRYDRRRLMIGCDLLRVPLVALLPLLLHFGWLNVAVLTVVAALLGIMGAPFIPARNALVAQVVPVENLVAANGLLQVSFSAAYFVGPLLLTPLVTFFSFSNVFLVDALTFVSSVITLVLIRVSPIPSPDSHPGLWADLLAGWQALKQSPEVSITITTFVLAILIATGFLTVGVVALVDTQLRGGAGQYGLLLGIGGLAEVVGALILTRLPLHNLAIAAVLAWMALGVFRVFLGFATALPVAVVLLALIGMFSALTDIALTALVQSRIAQCHLAKVMGLWEAGVMGALAVSPPLASFTFARIGLQGGFILSGTMLIALSSVSTMLIVRIQTKHRPKRAVP
jgi:MFS family permease